MKAIIIGVPGRGKTHLCNLLCEYYPDARVVKVDKIRETIGIYEPLAAYETEVAAVDIPLLEHVLDCCIKHYQDKDMIIEGYGLAPESALSLSRKYDIPVVILTHQTTSVAEDVELIKKYDDERSRIRTKEYLLEVHKFYKEIEKKWIKRMPRNTVFATERFFKDKINKAFQYLLDNQG